MLYIGGVSECCFVKCIFHFVNGISYFIFDIDLMLTLTNLFFSMIKINNK